MSRWIKAAAWVAIAATCVAVLYLLYVLFLSFSGASDTIKVATIGAFVSIATLILSRYFEQKRLRHEHIANERIAIYRRFLDMFFRALENEAVSRALKRKPITKDARGDWLLAEIYEFQKEIVFWGSDETIEKWLQFRSIIDEYSSDVSSTDSSDERIVGLSKMLNIAGELIIQMRRDIGYSSTTMKPKDIAFMILKSDDPENRLLLEKWPNKKLGGK